MERKVLEVRFLRRFRRLFGILQKRRDSSRRFLEIPLAEVEILARFRRLFRRLFEFFSVFLLVFLINRSFWLV